MRVSARARSESAFTLIETIMAAVLLLIVAAALAGVLTSSIAAHTTARERTLAEEAANDQIEAVRNMDYGDAGINCATGSPCNPPGLVDASVPLVRDGLTATIATQISYVGDALPTSYATNANYKKVTVTVTRDRDSKQLARSVTYLAPVQRAPFGGINKSIVNVQVMDYKLNSPLQGAAVTIANGPDAPRTDISDASGLTSFAAMIPTTGSQYYDLAVTLAGYETLPVDLPPAPVAHLQVAPSQTAPTSQIRVFKPGTINVRVESSPGVLYTGSATVQVTSSTPLSGTSTFTTSSGLVAVTTVAGQHVVPGVSYSIKALTSTPLCANASPTWTNYPADPTTTVTLSLAACPSGSLTVNVQQLGTNAPGATVQLTGGPNNISVTSSATNSSGNVTFTSVPAGSGYTLVASKLSQSSPSVTTAVTVAGPNTATLTLPTPPTGTLTANVQQLGAAASGATVDLSGGPYSINVSPDPTTDSSGNVTFTNVPVGTGYTLIATKLAQSSPSVTAAVTLAGPNNASLTLPNPPTGSVQATVTWLGAAQSGASVRLYGGPYSIDTTLSPTSGTGQVTFPNVPSGTGYSVDATKNGQTTTVTGLSVSTGVQAPASVALPTGKIDVTVTWAGQAAGILPSAGTVTITGGPLGGTYTGSTAASGLASITVPTTNATYPYTVKASKTGSDLVTAGSQVTSVTTSPNATSSVALTPTKVFTITIQRGLSTANGASLSGLTVSITGGPNGNAGLATVYQFTPVGTNTSSVITTTITVPAVVSGTTPNYTVKVWGCSLSGTTNKIGTTSNVSAATGTTAVTVNLNSASGATCPPTTP